MSQKAAATGFSNGRGFDPYEWSYNDDFDDPMKDEEEDQTVSVKEEGDDSGGGESKQRLNPQREKNREAVRNCRKRKKEHVQQLKDRIDELVEENRKLKLELQLGMDEKPVNPTVWSESEHDLIFDMQKLVEKAREEEQATSSKRNAARRAQLGGAKPPKSDTEVAIRRKIQVYMERHQDHGRDRQKAIGFILGRLQRLVEPEMITKLYLHMMTSHGEMNLESDELRDLKIELNLTPEQAMDFSARRRYVKRLRTELDCAINQTKSIIEKCKRNKKVGDSLNELTSILRPEQFARFVVWVHSNPACKDILDELWDKLLAKCDLQINAEIQANHLAVQQIKRFQQNSAALAMHLFSIPDPQARESIAKLCVHPDVVLVDANNNVDKRGLKSVIRYMGYVSHAFDTQSCEKTKSLRALNVEEKRIESDTDDDKVTGAWRLSGVYIGRLRPRRQHNPSQVDSPAMPFGSTTFNLPANLFTLPSSVVEANNPSGSGANKNTGSGIAGTSPKSAGVNLLSPSTSSVGSSGVPEPLLTKEEQRQRTVSFNVMVEFSFADPKRRDLISEMVISWDALSLVNQLGLLKSPVKGVLPPPNIEVTPQSLPSTGEQETGASGTPQQIQPRLSVLRVMQDATQGRVEPEEKAIENTVNEQTKPLQSPPESNSAPEMTDLSSSTMGDGQDQNAQNFDSAESVASPVPPEKESLGRANARRLADLFERKTHEEREIFAIELLDPKCTFDDIHMGIKYKGIPACLGYIKRLRRAFPTFNIGSRILSESKVITERQQRRRSESHTSIGSGGNDSVDATNIPDIFEIKWDVSGFYDGSLVKEPKPCHISGKVFVTTCALTSKILDVKLDVSAQNLMQQIGLLAESTST